MSQLILHIGSHKTGTTAVQFSCGNGVTAADGGEAHYLNIRPAGIRIVRINGAGADFSANIKPGAAERALRPVNDTAIHIASDEDLFWIDQPESVLALAGMLRERFRETRIICYLRRQDQVALAHRKQVIEGMPAMWFYGINEAPLPDFQPHYLNYFDYATKLKSIWCYAFGKENVTVVPFHPSVLTDHDIIADFAYRAGIRFDKPAGRRNQSMAGNKTMLGLFLANRNIPAKQRLFILSKLKPSGQFLPTRQQARDFLANFDAANERLAAEWQWDDAPLRFDSSLECYPDEARQPGWSHAEALEMLSTLWDRANCDQQEQAVVTSAS